MTRPEELSREMKQKRGQQELSSLIPSVRNTEQRFDELMAEARTRAESAVAEAHTRSEQAIRGAQAGLPEMLAAERDEEMRRLRREAEDAARAERELTVALGRNARAAFEAAVAFVVGRVWPGGRG